MAKGFTVKAKTPTASEPEWDYNLAREMVKGKTIVFCLPGRGVSYTYLKNFVQLCFDLVQAGASIQISQDYSSMVNFARCKCLGANVLRGPDQIPWDGKLKYDWQLWIDSDIVFNTEKFWQLVLMDQDIASGWYCTLNAGRSFNLMPSIESSFKFTCDTITLGCLRTASGSTPKPWFCVVISHKPVITFFTGWFKPR